MFSQEEKPNQCNQTKCNVLGLILLLKNRHRFLIIKIQNLITRYSLPMTEVATVLVVHTKNPSIMSIF